MAIIYNNYWFNNQEVYVMKKINVTFSIPYETNKLLHSLVSRRKMSVFVTQALQKALGEELEALEEAYAQAEQDPDRQATIEDWRPLDVEGWE
jgi:hypothetical protein